MTLLNFGALRSMVVHFSDPLSTARILVPHRVDQSQIVSSR